MKPPDGPDPGDGGGEGGGDTVRKRPRRSRPKESTPTTGVRRRTAPRRPASAPVRRRPKPPPADQPPADRGEVIPLRTVAREEAPAAPGGEDRDAGAATVAEAAPGEVAEVVARPQPRPRARPRRGLRATFGPERVAALLVVLLIGIAVPVALGVSLPTLPASTPATSPPASPAVSPSGPSSQPPASSPSGSQGSEPSFSPAVVARIENVLLAHGRVFRDSQALEAELARGAASRPEILKGLITNVNADAFTSIGQVNNLRAASELGDLPTRLLDRYEAIRAAARAGLDGAARDRAIQVDSATRVVEAVAALRPLDDELRGLLAPTPS